MTSWISKGKLTRDTCTYSTSMAAAIAAILSSLKYVFLRYLPPTTHFCVTTPGTEATPPGGGAAHVGKDWRRELSLQPIVQDLIRIHFSHQPYLSTNSK